MAKKKNNTTQKDDMNQNTHILGAGIVMQQNITDTLETNFMPYAMSVILSRAIPEIDGFKPSHRKLLYTMYKMGLLTGAKTKSANIVGQTMKLNPHGDAAIYDTMVRLSRGYEALLHPLVDSKGNFGKAYSRDMQCAAPRYTEAKLAPICAELFTDIDRNTVDFVDNYDNTMKEPSLLPVRFPTVLANPTTGIAVGMASSICPFNLQELCDTTVALVKNPEADITDTLRAPDFSGGGLLVYDKDAFEEIYATGKGSFKVRAKYRYDKDNRCIEITEIPPTTTAEAIIDKVIEKFKAGSVREIGDIRDETDKSGLKITIDLKKGSDPDKLMQRLYKMTPLEDSFACNFNVLVKGYPRVMGVKELLIEWIRFRGNCVYRRVKHELQKAESKLHLLKGLEKILLDIDKAISIVRNTEEESDVVPNLMIGFGIDEIQAEYVAEIKLRHLNREYILKRLQDIEQLTEDIADMQEILESKSRIKKIIIEELNEVAKKYAQPRKSEIIILDKAAAEQEAEPEIPDYPVNLFFTKEGYFKKITPLSLRMSGEHKLKDGDEIVQTAETANSCELLFFTNRCQVYKSAAYEFDDSKASVLGDFIATKLEMDEGEQPVYMAVVEKYEGYMLFFFENGKVAKVDVGSYATKQKRKKLINAYCDKSPLVAVRYVKEDTELLLRSSGGRALVFPTGAILPKTTKDTQGVAVFSLKKNQTLSEVSNFTEDMFEKPARYRAKSFPSTGAIVKDETLYSVLQS